MKLRLSILLPEAVKLSVSLSEVVKANLKGHDTKSFTIKYVLVALSCMTTQDDL